MIAVFTKMSYIWVFMSIATMIAVLKENCGCSSHKMPYFWFLWGLWLWSQFSKMPHFWVSPHRWLRSWVTILILASLASTNPVHWHRMT